MSLDVYLILPGVQNLPSGPQILIREDGVIKPITREEWDRRFPGREPVETEIESDDQTVYRANITHNLTRMAKEAGIYLDLWEPKEIGITQAKQLITPLTRGLALLRQEPERFIPFNPSNGWGNYEGFVKFVERYLYACQEYPEAIIEISR